MVGRWRRVGKSHCRRCGKEVWDLTNGGKKVCYEGTVTSFFITEFGDNWSVNDLFYELKEYGELEDIVVPPRRDRRGRRYGFSRFQNVKDEKMLSIKLDNIILEGRKLYANLPRFQRPLKTSNNFNRVNNVSARFTNNYEVE